MIKTYKKWQESDKDLTDYLPKRKCQIDEELYYYITEVVPPHYSDDDITQMGEARYEKNGKDYYVTVQFIYSKREYYYLGILKDKEK